MTTREQTNEEGKIATTRRHPSSNQDLGDVMDTGNRGIAFDRKVASGSSAKSSKASKKGRSKGQESTNDPGSVPVIPPQQKKNASEDDEKKHYRKLELASVTAPFPASMIASRPTDPSSTLKGPAKYLQSSVGSVPGAIPVLPSGNSTNASWRDQGEPPSSVADNNNAITESDDLVRNAVSHDHDPCVHAYVINDDDIRDRPAEEESTKRWSPAMRYGILVGVVVVVALIVTLVVVFSVNRAPAPVAKVQYVQYQGAWYVLLPPTFSPNTNVSDLELTCLDGGILKSPVIFSGILGIKPACSFTGNSTIRCTQAPVLQVNNTVAVAAGINFQCHGTNPDQLVGKASVFNATIFAEGGSSGSTDYYAAHGVGIYIIDQTTNFIADDECSAPKIPNPIETNSDIIIKEVCGSYAVRVSDGVNRSVFVFEEISATQRAPVKSTYIYDA